MPFLIFWLIIAVIVIFAIKTAPKAIAPNSDLTGSDGWDPELKFAIATLKEPVWSAHMWDLLGLASEQSGPPVILDMEPTPVGASIDLLLPMGRPASQWQRVAPAIADSLHVPDVRITSSLPGSITLDLVIHDPLANETRVPRAEYSDLESIPCGNTDAGGTWSVCVLGRHILYAGVSGSGKSSSVWALIAGLGPAIRDGLVELWGIDPKRVELEPGRDLFTRLVVHADDEAVGLLRELVDVLDERLDKMSREGIRKHIPNRAEPLIVCWIDEILMLTAFSPDSKVRSESDKLIRHLLSQGRAAAISLIPCAQDPSKEVMAWRQMVTMRIGLRMDEENQTSMVLGSTARDNGALCDAISDQTPGVAYVGEDGRSGFMRVRAYRVTDADIADLVRWFTPKCRHPGCDHRGWDDKHLRKHQGPSHRSIKL